MITYLTTAKAVLDTLGGYRAVGVALGIPRKTVHGWGRNNHFPARFFEAMTKALLEKGASAPSSLWRQHPIPQRDNPQEISD